MNPATDMHFGKTPLTPSHGDSLVDQSFQSLKSKEIRDSLSPTHEIKFRNSGGVAGGVLVPDTTGWDVQTSSEVSPDGRAFRTESLAKTDGVEKIPGGHAEFAGRNEQKSSASHQGDDKNYVKKAAESSKTHLQEKVVIGDENSGRTEMKSSSVTSSSKVISSSSQQVFSSEDPGFDMQPRRLTNHQDQHYQNVLQKANNNSSSTVQSERQQFSRNERNERQETSSNTIEESKKYVDMDKASPEYQQHVQYLMSQPGAIVSNTVEYPKPGVKMITTVKKLPDGTTVKTKRYETEASAAAADTTSISQTMKQQQKISSNTSTTQKLTEKRIADSEDVFTRLSRTRDANVPASPRHAPETPSQEDIYSRLQQSRDTNEQKFSDSIDQRSTQILRDTNQHPGSRNAPIRRPSDLVENVEVISKTNKTIKKDLSQSIRSEKITSSDFIQNERDRYVRDHESPSRRGPDGYPEALAPITPSRHGRPQPDDYPTNGYNATEVIKQSSSSKSSAKFSENRRFSTETVESYHENENQDYTTQGYPSNRRPINEPKGQSPSGGRPGPDYSTHGFPSVRSDKPTQQHPSDKPRSPDEHNTTERVHIIHTDRNDTTRSNYTTNETRRNVTSTNEDYSTHGFPSVRAGTPTRDSPRRPLGAEPSPGESPRRPSGQEPPAHQARRPPTDGYSTHGFPSVKNGSPTEDSPRRPSGAEPTSQGRRPTTEDFSTHGFPSVKPGRSTPTQSAPQYESSPRVDREDTVSVTSDRSNSITYEKKIDAAHQAFARSLRCASPVESVRRDSTSDRHTPRSSIGSIRNSYSPSKRDGRSPSHDSVTNSESSRISSATVTKSHKPTEVRRLSSPKSPIGKSSPSHVSNETIDLTLTRKITARPSPDKAAGKPTTIKEEQPVIVEPILRKKIFGATEDFLASEGVIEKPINKNQYYQLGLSDATLPSSRLASKLLGTTTNTSRRAHHNTEEELNTLIDTATKHTTPHPQKSPVTPTTRSTKNKEPKTVQVQPKTIYSKKPLTAKPEGYITLSEASEITEKHNQTTDKHVSYPHYIPSAPKADRSPSDRPTTNNLSSPAPFSTTTTSTTPHNAPKSTKDNKVKSPSNTTTPKPLSSPSKVDNSTTSRFTKTVKVENAINRDTTTKTRRQPDQEPESELDTEPLAEPEDLDEGYVPDRKGKRKPSSQRPTSDDEGFEPDSPRAGSPTSDFEYRRPEQVRETYDEEDSIFKKTKRTDKKVVTNDFLNTERNVTKTRTPQDTPSHPVDEEPKRPGQDGRKPSYSVDKPTEPYDDEEPKRPQRRPKEDITDQTPSTKDRKPSQLVDEPRKTKGPENEPSYPDDDNRRPSHGKEPSRPDDESTRPSEPSRPRGTKPPLERSETFEERCRQILGMNSETVVDQTNKTQEFIETERTTVDSKHKPSDSSPSPKKRQPSDTVSIEDCDDDDDDQSYPSKTTKTTTTVKTTREYPRDRSPNKKEPTSRPKEDNTGDRPRDRSPVGKLPKGPKTNEYDETTTIVTTTKITDDRSPSPNRKSPREGKPTYEDNIRPRGRSPTGKVDETTTSRKTTKVVDEIDERTTRSKPGSRPRDQSPQETRPGDKSPSFGRSPSPNKKQPSDTVSIEDCDDDSDTPSKYTTSKTKTTTTTVKTTRDEPRDKSPSTERRPNRKTPKEVQPSETDDDYHPRDRSPSEKPGRVNETTSIQKTTEIVDEIDRKTTRSGPGSRPRDQSPQARRPREESPTNDRLPKDRSPSETRTFITTRETTFDVDTTTRGKSPLKQPAGEESPSHRSPQDKSPSKKPTRGTSPSGDYPRDRSPTGKPVRESSPTGETPRGKSPLKKPIRGSTPTEEYPRDRSPTRKPVTDETVIISTTTTHSNVTDGVIEDRYPSYTPKSYPRDRSPIDKQKTKPHHITEEEDVTIQTSKKTKKISTEEIHDDVFEVKRPRERQPDTRDGSYISIPRDQSPTEPSSRPRTNETPRDRSPEKPTTKETNVTITKKTTKKTSDITVQSEFPDKSPVSRPKDSPRDRSPSKKPTTDETEEYRTTTTTRRTQPNDYPRDRSPVDDLTRPKTKSINETHRIDKTTVINEFLDTERGVVERPQRPKDNKPFDNRSPDQLTSQPKDYPVTKESPTSKLKGPIRTSIDESTTIKSIKTTKDTRIENEVKEVFPTTRPRDRSPTEKPLRSPKIVTTETTTEYGIRSRPRSRSPSEEPEKPSDTEEIDETYVQKTSKKTEKKTITTDLDVDVVKPSRRPRPTGTEDQPREKSPQKSKPSDRSPSPRSRYPKDQGPRPVENRPHSKSPVGKQPRQSSPSEKSRIYKSTDEQTNVVNKSKTTKVTTTSTDVEDVEFENRPRGRSPSEKPRTTGPNQSPRDQPRRSSPTKVPRDREPVDTDYEEVVKRTNKTTRNETTLEERIDRSPIRKYPEDKPREKSPLSKNRGPRPTEETENHFPKSPRGTSPSEKPTSRDYPRDRSPTDKPGSRNYPRDRSPSDKPRQPSTIERTTTESTTTTERLSKSPRGTSPTGKPHPKDYSRDRSPSDKSKKPGVFDETVIVETTSESTTTKDRFSKSPRHSSPSEKPGQRDYPRDRSPTEKPRKSVPNQETSPTRKPIGRQPRPVGETVVQRTVKTTTVDDRTTKTPRGSSPIKTLPRERSPTQKQPTKDSPRRTSPSEKPSRRQPVVSEVEKTVRKTTSKFNKDKTISEKIIVQDHPRRKSPSEKPRRRPTSDDETDEDDENTETVIAVYTIDGETVKNHPRDLSPSGRPKQPREYSPKRPQTNGDSHRPTDEETEEIFISSTTRLTKQSKTFDIEEDEDHSPRKTYPADKPKITRGQPRLTSPSGKPRTRQPTDESIDITVVKKTSRTQKGETTVEETEYRSPEDHPRDRSPSGKPSSVRSYPRDSSPQKPIDEDIDDETIVVKSYRKIPFDDSKSPLQKPNGPHTTEETVLYTTKITSQIEDYPRDRSPSDKPGTRSYPRDRSPTEKPGTKTYPGDKSPSDKPTRPRPSKLEETTNRSTTVQRKVQETDFEKRYPKGRPGDQSPSEKPSTLRRPSKLSTTTTTTTTTRNRSTLDEQDINRTQRPRTQPSTRDKIPTKTTPLSSTRSQPTTERRVPADLPSPIRKPKSTFGATTKTTTTVTSRLTGATRPKPTTESPKKPSKLPVESRPSSRPTERKHSPSISPDSSPSRPSSDVEVDSPYRSPNMSPSRKSPSPTRSVKLEDITETVSTTRKTTVSIDKSKPKVTHVTTAKFQVTPPTSPTKVTSSPEKFSPSSKKPSSKVPTSKSNGSKFTSDTTTTKKVTSKVYKEVPVPTDSERDSEVPTDAEEVDTSFPQKPSSRKLPVTERKESAPVHRVTKVNKDVQMSRSTSENIIKTPINRRPVRNEPLETQRESPRPINGDRSSPKTERRPSKHLSTKTINLTTFDKVINSEDMENVVIDIQHAKSSREPSPNKIVPTPVSVDIYTGKPRYPDVVQEPEDEPKRKPNVKNIPIFEEETNDFVGCQITEVSEETNENTVRARTTKFIEKESIPRRQTPKIITGDNVDSECLLSVHDKVSKFISTAEEVSKPKTSAPFRRDIPEKDMPEDDDECLLTVDEKVSKFLKTADSVTKEVITSKPRRVERPSIEDLDEDLKTDECVLSVSEKVNKFTTKAEKLAPSAPQRSPELVARIERQISRPSDVEESESPEDSPVSVRKFKPTSPLTERTEKKYTERQIDILSRPSVWEKKPKPDVKLDDIIGFTPEEEPRREGSPKTYPEDGKSKPDKSIDSVSKRKELFENKVSTNKTTTTTIKQSSPEKRPSRPAKSPSERHPSDDSDSRYPNEFIPQYVDGYAHQEPDDDVHKDVYGSSRTRNIYEVSHQETVQRSTERSPTRKSSHPENRPTTQTTIKSPRQPEDKTPSRRYSEDHSPRYPTRDQPLSDRYTETRELSDHTTRRRSSTQEYPERRTPYNGSPSPRRNQQPVEEPEDYTFSSRRDETTTHHTTRNAPRTPKDNPLNETSFLDDDERDLSPARSTSTVSSHKQVTTHRSTSKRVTEDISSRRPRRPSGNEPSTPTSSGRTPRGRAVPETVAARRNIFEKSPGDISPMPTNRRPSYMEPTKSSLEHRKDSLEITKTNYSRKSSVDEEPYEPSPRTSVKFGVGLKHKEEPKPKRKLSSSDIPNIEDVYELDLLEEMLNIVTLYEQRRRIRAQIRVVKKLLETKTKEEVSRMTKISTIRKTSSSSVRESPIPTSKRETPVRSEKYHPLTDDEIDSESIIESRHIEEHEEIIRERSISPKTKTSRIVTKVTEVRKIGEPTTQTTTTTTTNKRTPLKKDEPKDSKPIWATKNILKKPSDNEKVTRALSAKKTTSTSSSSMSRTQQTHRQRVATDDDCVTSSYGIGPTDEDGRPLFGIRALKKKTTTNTNNTVQPSETTKVTGTVITEKYYSENGAEPVGERKVTVYSTNPEDLVDMETQYDRRDSETVKREKLSKDGLTTVTKVQKIGKYKPGEIPSLTDDAEFTKATSKMVRRGSVKEMSEKFIRKESSSSVTEKSSGYPKAGLILRTRTNSGATADAADQYEVRAKSTEYDYDSEDDVEIRSSRKHSKVVTESEDETSEVRRKINTRSFLNSGGSKVTGVDDVLDRMRNADNVVVDGDTMEDREARSLLNKFLGASVLMSGMESMIPQMELRKSTAGADNKQEVKTTRVTKTIKSGTTGGSSSSPVARETCDFEEIWDEEILKQLLEKSTSYEERRSIRARLRQLMAEREACAELKASAKAELNETKVKTSTIVAEAEDESSGSEYEEIIEEYTASEDDDEDEETTTTTTTVIADKQQKDEVKEEKSTKQITEGIKKTTITKKEEPKSVESKKTVIVETTTVVVEEDNDDDDSSASHSKEKKLSAKSSKEEETNIVTKENDNDGDSDSVSDSKGLSTTTTEKTETKKEDGGVVTTTTKVTTRTISGAPKPVSPFAKFQQLDKQNSLQSPKSPLTPTTPGGSSTTPIFRFTDPALNARAATFKEQLLQWCQSKTQEYENVQITNFSASWTDGLAFCALIHHFLPDAFDYSKLNPKQRRYNFELAFRVADEKAGIAPLLDVEDMVVMKRPDWKCVFTYVQSIYRRFRNCQ
ncbi:titin isoform X2 [Eupeodes corollae]|nr:titin isoform X2 [Eupeodes corollae]XP_055912988.1 titin isoform X2 [Eupeodes corollae]